MKEKIKIWPRRSSQIWISRSHRKSKSFVRYCRIKRSLSLSPSWQVSLVSCPSGSSHLPRRRCRRRSSTILLWLKTGSVEAIDRLQRLELLYFDCNIRIRCRIWMTSACDDWDSIPHPNDGSNGFRNWINLPNILYTKNCTRLCTLSAVRPQHNFFLPPNVNRNPTYELFPVATPQKYALHPPSITITIPIKQTTEILLFFSFISPSNLFWRSCRKAPLASLCLRLHCKRPRSGLRKERVRMMREMAREAQPKKA
ncbi:hypothetical protein AUEXF2481DRAFT_264090 [Aureobasidium subglaciale EXF-2481]|uniref:Uncharacterized protein n=1 Tax=Aureobasidium subglaciale (strain EXF-2481) TaxID=1043005 RepID=A0A074YDZ4_AURSE|nr:uncharacterized protein AUEXF2481DRAFT_264090 [Aureobasidium subglaciale EXF-2481]KEQ94269.1 hypothetical protein AUEXF2481DRAFT_264090 [Aureobasidium subglaciale EXF-2481]